MAARAHTLATDRRLRRRKAVNRLMEHGISCLPVTAGEVLVGIVTNTDLHVVLETLLESRPASFAPAV